MVKRRLGIELEHTEAACKFLGSCGLCAVVGLSIEIWLERRTQREPESTYRL